MMAISLSGTDSHRSSGGAIQSRRVLKNEKRRWESPIATIFSVFQTSSISMKADSRRPARIREIREPSEVANSRRSDWSLLSGFNLLQLRRSDHIGSDSKSAGTIAWRLEVN